MDLIISGHTQRSFGGGPWSFVGDLLIDEFHGFGAAIETIELIVFCNGSLQEDSRGFPPLDAKRSVKFFRKKKTLKISYPSSRFSPDTVFKMFLTQFSRAHVQPAFDEMLEALRWGMETRVSAQDDFDLAAFLTFFEGLRPSEYSSDEELREAVRRGMESRKAKWDKLNAWEKLDISWDDFHKDARKVLDDPADWSNTDDFSPHGNDTGADILASWSDFSEVSPKGAATRLGWSDFDLKNELYWSDWVKINLALAFGHIKLSGTCSPRIAADVIGVLTKEIRRAEKLDTWSHQQEYLRRMRRYVEKLGQFE